MVLLNNLNVEITCRSATGTNFAAAANTTAVYGQITFEIQ